MQGIGPRRLETIERTNLIDKQYIFFDASETSLDPRRAASVGPGAYADSARSASINGGLGTRPRSRSRGLAARASSLVPRPGHVHAQRSASPTPASPPPPALHASVLTPGAGSIQPPSPPQQVPSSSDERGPLSRSMPPSTTHDQNTGSRPPLSASTSASATPQSPSRSAGTGKLPGLSHRTTGDRAAELRAEASVPSSSSSGSPPARNNRSIEQSLSPAGSRASSLHDYSTGAASTGTGTDIDPDSRAPSILSYEESENANARATGDRAPNGEAASASFVSGSNAPVVATPDGLPENELELVTSNVSQISLSSTSDRDAEQRGRTARRDLAIPPPSHASTSDHMAASTSTSAQIARPSTATVSSASPTPHRQISDQHRPHTALRSVSAASASSSAAVTMRASPSPSPSPAGRGISPAPSAMRQPSRTPSASAGISANGTQERASSKSARFSLSSFVRGKSVTGHRHTSPDREAKDKDKDRERSNDRGSSRGRSAGLKAIKQALTHASSSVAPYHSDTDDGSDVDDDARGRARNHNTWQEFKPGTYNYPIYSE